MVAEALSATNGMHSKAILVLVGHPTHGNHVQVKVEQYVAFNTCSYIAKADWLSYNSPANALHPFPVSRVL